MSSNKRHYKVITTRTGAHKIEVLDEHGNPIRVRDTSYATAEAAGEAAKAMNAG